MYFRIPGRPIIGGIAVAIVLLYFLFPIGWLSPGQDEFYIFRNMTGEDLPPGQILAEAGQKGVTREIHAQGWYFFNRAHAPRRGQQSHGGRHGPDLHPQAGKRRSASRGTHSRPGAASARRHDPHERHGVA